MAHAHYYTTYYYFEKNVNLGKKFSLTTTTTIYENMANWSYYQCKGMAGLSIKHTQAHHTFALVITPISHPCMYEKHCCCVAACCSKKNTENLAVMVFLLNNINFSILLHSQTYY